MSSTPSPPSASFPNTASFPPQHQQDDETTETSTFTTAPDATLATTLKTASKKRAAWILHKLQGTVSFLTPNRRASSRTYTKVGDEDDTADAQDTTVEMTRMEDIDLEEYDSSPEEDLTTGISAALDLPAPWKINSPTRPSNTTTPHPSSSSSSSSSSHHDAPPKTFGLNDALQIVPTLLLASLALAVTGGVLDQAQHWVVFQTRTAYFVAMPMLFGIKGNLDMTLASRLTSALHSGELTAQPRAATTTPGTPTTATGATSTPPLSLRDRRIQIYQCSLALLQVQAIVCGFIAGVFTMLMTQIVPSVEDVVTIIASIVVTSMIAAFVFGLLTFGLVLGGHRVGCDPDNIATPIVSSLGDLASLVLLAAVASGMDWFSTSSGMPTVAPVVLLVCAFAALPCLWCIAAKDKACQQALKSGWVPILLALGISQFAGVALETSIVSYQGVGIFVLFINGFGGNMGCIYASRICSMLHASKGQHVELLCPISGFLLTTSFIFEGIWLIVVAVVGLGHVDVSWNFSCLYLLATTVQVCVLLLFVRTVAPMLMAIRIDPDNFMTPSLTALGDLVGTFILWAVFIMAEEKTGGGGTGGGGSLANLTNFTDW